MYKYVQEQALEPQIARLGVAADVIQDAAYEMAADIDEATITELMLASKIVEGLVRSLQSKCIDRANENVVKLFS